jgi:hypothetical protein
VRTKRQNAVAPTVEHGHPSTASAPQFATPFAVGASTDAEASAVGSGL